MIDLCHDSRAQFNPIQSSHELIRGTWRQTRFSVYSHCRRCLNTSSERQFSDSELQTEAALMLKALADNESAIHGTTDSNSLSVDRSVHSGW